MALYGSLATIRGQLADPAHFASALACLEEAAHAGSRLNRLLAELAPGRTERVELGGGAFALPQVYLTHSRAEGRWETHGAFVDVQAVLEGEEFMEIADRACLTVAEDLTPARDVIFYQPYDRGSVLRLTPGLVAVYFPPDAHLGGVAPGAPGLVRKVVVKVPVKA